MATALEPRPLADLEQDQLVAVEEKMARRALGLKPWTPSEYIDEIEKVHARYAAWRLALQKWQGTS
ncbi:hypothetical protein [Streptomyces sp. NPDC003832]